MSATIQSWKCDRLREDGCLDLIDEQKPAQGGLVKFMKWCPRRCGNGFVQDYQCPKEKRGA